MHGRGGGITFCTLVCLLDSGEREDEKRVQLGAVIPKWYEQRIGCCAQKVPFLHAKPLVFFMGALPPAVLLNGHWNCLALSFFLWE